MTKRINACKHLNNPKKSLKDIINKMKLHEYINKDFKSLSHGEQRWIELSTAIACDNKVILIDGFGQYLGSEKIIYSQINGSEIRIKSTKNIKDKNITIYLPKNKLYLFDNNKNRLKK